MSWRYLVCNPQLLAFGTHLFTKSISVKWTGEKTMTTGAGTRQQVGNKPITLVRCSSYWTKQVVLFSPCTPAATLKSQYKNVHWIKTVFYSIHFLAVRWGLIWVYPVYTVFYSVHLLGVHTCHISHCEIKSHIIWPIWKAIPIKNSNLTEFSDHFTVDFMKK